MAFDLVDTLLGAIVSLPVGGLGGWVGANWRIDKKLETFRKSLIDVIGVVETRAVSLSEHAKAAALAEFENLIAALRTDLVRLERDLEALENQEVKERIQSANDLANAAAMAKSLDEVRSQCQQTSATLNRILGLLQGKGIHI